MVRATTSFEPKRFDLQSVEGGWVELRNMSYGDFLARRDMAMEMSMDASDRNKQKIDVGMVQKAVTQFEFSKCIVDHNLEDENGRKLTLSESNDFSRLDSQIGEEISKLIDNIIQWTDPKSEGEVADGNQPSSDESSDADMGS